MSSVIDNIKRNSDDFSFLSTFFDLVGNKEFKHAEISTLYTNNETKFTSIWRSLSAVAQQFGTDFYESTLNFIDGICNIDSCKIKQLQSLIDQLGVNYIVLDNIHNMPLDVQNLIDLLSMKREYLIDNTKMNEKFISDITNGAKYDDFVHPNCIEDISCLSHSISSCNMLNEARKLHLLEEPELSNVWKTKQFEIQNNLNDEKMNSFTISAFYYLLSSKITQTYNNKAVTFIYQHLSNAILLSDFELPNDCLNKIAEYKTLHNIKNTFNVQNEVDKIENGEVDLSDYTEHEMSVLQFEINHRKEPFIANELKTRYKFYRERETKEYTEFIQNEYNNSQLSNNYLSCNTYSLDSSYIELYLDSKNNSTKKLFNFDTQLKSITFDKSMLYYVSSILADIVESIREIREQLKEQCQKNYMRGTRMFIKYIIQQFLSKNIVKNLKQLQYLSDYVFDEDTTAIDFIDYVDRTKYFNISCMTDVLLSNEISDQLINLNPQYWNDFDNIGNDIKTANDTNLFKELSTYEQNATIFSQDELSSLYIGNLKNKFLQRDTTNLSTQIDILNDFLNLTYSLGAENTFVSDDIFHTYDSYEIKQELFNMSTANSVNITNITEKFSSVSGILSTVPYVSQIDKTLAQQVKQYRNEFLNAGKSENAAKITNLSIALAAANELNSKIMLSAVVIELSDKYLLNEQAVQIRLDQALQTDSFEKQKEYDAANMKMNYDYVRISSSYSTVSDYIPTDFKQENLTLSVQIVNLCASLSSLSDEKERAYALSCVRNLSSDVLSANEMSSEIELQIILETLDVKYQDQIALKLNELNEIRNTDLFKYRQQLHEQYSGHNDCNTPYYYLDNERHPSFMIHPYVCNFSEKQTNEYSIDSIVNVDSIAIEQITELSELMDDDGYLIDVWKNPLNVNDDYLTRYEFESHYGKNGKVLEQIAYDGLFYPKAFNDLTSDNTVFKKTISANYRYKDLNELTGDFITSLSGVQCISKSTGKTVHLQWNPWYEEFDLTENECHHIAEQLKVFKDMITKIVKFSNGTSYDIFKYGLDSCKNSYGLIKKCNINDDYDEKCKADGMLWMRVKNHPIAFPAYVLTCQNGIWKDSDLAQIHVEDGKSTTEHHELKMMQFEQKNEYKFPVFKDFMFNDDNNVMVLNGQLSTDFGEKEINASYPLLAEIDKTYNAIDEMTYHLHKTIKNKYSVDQYAIIQQSYLEKNISDWNFEAYYNYDQKIGVIYSHVLSCKLENDDNKYVNSISVFGAFYDLQNQTTEKSEKTAVETLCCSFAVENVCIDVNKRTMTIAYLDDRPDKLSNYVKNEVDFSLMNEMFNEQYDEPFVIKTKQYVINNNKFILNNEMPFVKYTDIGYHGLIGSTADKLVENKYGKTYLGRYDLKNRGIYKFMMLSENITDIHKMIDFKQIIPIRPFENYEKYYEEITTLHGNKLSVMSFLCSHYFEPATDESTCDLINYSRLSADSHIYHPKDFIKTVEPYFPKIKTDECIENINSIAKYPLLYLCADNEVIEKYEKPFGQTDIEDDNCIFGFSEASTSAVPLLSGSWCKYTDSEGKQQIQLDFNSYYYKTPGINTGLSANTYNKYGLFLNLQKAGDAGTLITYANPLSGQYEEIASYYIKNISDDKPKFMLSVNYMKDIQIDGFMMEHEDSLLISEGTVTNMIVNEQTTL